MSERKKHSGEVGHGKPPHSGRFRKGQSGNPKGRPQGTQNLSTLLRKVIFQKIVVKENGVQKTVTKFEAVAMQLTNKAAGGNVAAAKEILKWAETMEQLAVTNRPAPSLIVNFISPKKREPTSS